MMLDAAPRKHHHPRFIIMSIIIITTIIVVSTISIVRHLSAYTRNVHLVDNDEQTPAKFQISSQQASKTLFRSFIRSFCNVELTIPTPAISLCPRATGRAIGHTDNTSRGSMGDLRRATEYAFGRNI